MNFIFYFVLISTLINMVLVWYSHFSGNSDAAFQAAMANYTLTLIVFVEIYSERKK